MFDKLNPSVIGNDYLVMGTIERQVWRESLKQPRSIGEMLEHVHDFKEVWTVEYQPAAWYPADEPDAPKQAEKPPPRKRRPQKRKHKKVRRR